MSNKTIGPTGLSYLWSKIKSIFATKAEIDDIIDVIEENEEVVASALNDLNSRIENMVVEETDPTVPDWAKNPDPPSPYEIGALDAYSYVDGVGFNNGTTINHYTTCSTSASTTAKTASKANFQLSTGAEIIVKFTYTNTASNPTLNINSTGAKSIYYNGTNIPASALSANRVYKFVYDGSYYQLVGTLGVTKTSELTNDAGFLTSSDVTNQVGEIDSPVLSSAVYEYITEDERVIASALNDLNTRTSILEETVAYIDEDDGTSGSIDSGSSTLEGLSDVSINSPTNGQGLIYNSTTNKWINGTISGGGSGGDVNIIETVKVNGTALTPDANKAVDVTVPTESTVSGWGFTKNAGTITGVTGSNGLTGSGTSGSVTISHAAPSTAPTKSTSAVYPITIDQYGHITAAGTAVTIPSEVTESTVSGWGFTKNTGTLTGVTFNNVSATISNGVAAITATIPAAPGTLKTDNTTAQTASSSEALSGTINLHKVAKTGTYSDLIGTPTIPTVNNSTITVQMNGSTVDSFTTNASSSKTINLGTVITSHQTLKTINSTSLTGSGNIQIDGLPSVTTSDNGKVLSVSSGAWTATTPVTIYSGTSAPSSNTGANGDIYIQTS